MSEFKGQDFGDDSLDLHPELYDEVQFQAVDEHIAKFFGECSGVFHELISPDIHCDIYIVHAKDQDDRAFFNLITHGTGAHVMNVPDKFASADVYRAEFVVSLPSNWKVDSSVEIDYWPIRLLKVLSRLPIEEDSWLGPYHTVSLPDGFAQGTDFTGVLIVPALSVSVGADREEASICELPCGEGDVNFYQVIPLHQDELDFAVEHGSIELLKRFGDQMSYIIDPTRPSIL